MKTTKLLTRTLLLAGALALFGGCAGVQMKPSGFLASYEALKPTKPGKKSLAYHQPVVTGGYRAMILEPVCFATNAAGKLKPGTHVRLSANLTRRAQKVFSTKYQIVDQAGPGTLRLRMAVNDIKKSNPWINLLTTAGVFLPLDMGALSVEMEAVDSVTRQRVAALMDKRHGWPVTPKGFFGSFEPLGHVRSGFSCLAETMLNIVSKPETELARNKLPPD